MHENEQGEMVVCEWLRMYDPDFYCVGIFKLVPRWDRCICVLGNCVENEDAINELHLTL